MTRHQALHQLLIMRGYQHRGAMLMKVQQQRHDVLGCMRIQPDGGLVGQ